MNAKFKQVLAIAYSEAKKIKLIHWLFIFFVSLPLALVAAPFKLCEIIGKLISEFHTWLVKKLPDYDTEDVGPVSTDRGL